MVVQLRLNWLVSVQIDYNTTTVKLTRVLVGFQLNQMIRSDF
jgi:hypothetical protein